MNSKVKAFMCLIDEKHEVLLLVVLDYSFTDQIWPELINIYDLLWVMSFSWSKANDNTHGLSYTGVIVEMQYFLIEEMPFRKNICLKLSFNPLISFSTYRV